MNPTSIAGHASALAFQWLNASGVKPGQFVVTVLAGAAMQGGMPFSHNFPAIMDDFGNLVRVLEQS